MKNTKRLFEKKHVKDIEIFQKKKKKKRRKKARNKNQNFTEEDKEKSCQYYQERKQELPEYRRSYYSTHKK